MIARTAAGVAVAAILALAACGPRPEAPPAPVAPPPPTAPPPVASMPQEMQMLHEGLSDLEQIWHLRAALNVAALSCGQAAGQGQLVTDYNQFLARHRDVLARAYAAKQARFKAQEGAQWQRALDTHMTRLYNYFAWPPAQPAFCPTASEEARAAVAILPAQFEGYAPPAFGRVNQPFVRPAPAPRMAAARAAPMGFAAAPAPMAAMAASAPADGPWRVQLGAFTGQKGAEEAWKQIAGRSPDIAKLTPRYEPVPGNSRLVRLQVTADGGRANALSLCALASASGFDCLPVTP
ncbi:MAG: SPOR domain-containing protein [Thermaurantiacus sp.]